MNIAEAVARAPLWSQSPMAIVASVVSFVSLVVVAGAIVLDFVSYQRQPRGVTRSDRSFVETGSMTAFFVVYFVVIRFRLLEWSPQGALRSAMIVLGLVLMVAGVWVNVWGRLELGSNWANQIKIYDGHTLKTRGPYSIVRHPLYASLVWIFVGGSLVYSNALSLVLTAGVFVPMMVVRARKEDAALLGAFGPDYQAYQRRIGGLVPRLWGR